MKIIYIINFFEWFYLMIVLEIINKINLYYMCKMESSNLVSEVEMLNIIFINHKCSSIIEWINYGVKSKYI